MTTNSRGTKAARNQTTTARATFAALLAAVAMAPVVVIACDKGSDAADAGAAANAASAAVATAATAANAAATAAANAASTVAAELNTPTTPGTPGHAHPVVHGGAGADAGASGGGGAATVTPPPFVLPSNLPAIPSGLTVPTALPSGLHFPPIPSATAH